MVEAMVLGEVRYRPTLDMDEVVMEKEDINLPIIRWEDEEMDTGNVKEVINEQDIEGWT